jgi:hypothetical protein
MHEFAPSEKRPLFPYPKVAKYKGGGSTDEEKNFSSKD